MFAFIRQKINFVFFFFSIFLITIISLNIIKKYHIVSYDVPAFYLKKDNNKYHTNGLNNYNFKFSSLNIFKEELELPIENSIRHIHFTSNHEISWLINKEKLFEIQKKLTPEKLLKISKKIFISGENQKNYLKYLIFLDQMKPAQQYVISYDNTSKDFYITLDNEKIFNLQKNIIKLNQSISDPEIKNLLKKKKFKKIVNQQSKNINKIKENIINNNFDNLMPLEDMNISQINFIPRDIYKTSERYLKDNTYYYNTQKFDEKNVLFVDKNKISNLKINDCEKYIHDNGIKLDCVYFPFKISNDILNFNFF